MHEDVCVHGVEDIRAAVFSKLKLCLSRAPVTATAHYDSVAIGLLVDELTQGFAALQPETVRWTLYTKASSGALKRRPQVDVGYCELSLALVDITVELSAVADA